MDMKRSLGTSIKDAAPWGRKGASNNAHKSGQGEGGRELSCKWTSLSVRALEERREHLKVILSSSSCVEDWKIKANKNKCIVHIFLKEFLFLHSFFQLFNFLPTKCPHGQWEGGL